MTEKDLIELGFERSYENDEPLGPRHHYIYDLPLGSGWFMTTANVFVKNDEWGAWLDISADDVQITDMEDLKTLIDILEKYIPKPDAYLYT